MSEHGPGDLGMHGCAEQRDDHWLADHLDEELAWIMKLPVLDNHHNEDVPLQS